MAGGISAAVVETNHVREEQIVKAAAALFSSGGYTSTSMTEVADAVGLSKPGLYHYFPNKEKVLERVSQNAVDLLLAHLEGVLAMSGPVEHRLRELVIGRVEVICQNHDALKVFWQERGRLGRPANARLNKRFHSYHDDVVGLVTEGQRAGVIRSELDPHMVMLAMLGMTGWTYLWIKPDGRLTARQIGETFWRLISIGLFNRIPEPVSR